ncbi:MAG TPA: hypothetical protein VGB23_09750 [Nitrospirota bacterium]|jgi:hypothetical protein
MNRKDLMFLAVALAVVALLYVLSMSGKEPPKIPAGEVHAGITLKEDCKECHAPGKVKPMNPHHPFKDQCFNCHKRVEAGTGK